jgi:uncharacterized protein (TIGR00251 family)
MKVTETKDGAVLEVFVKPNQPKFKVTLDGDELVVFSTQEPVKGKVNKEILKEFSRLLNFKVEIVSGMTSRQKLLLVRGTDKAQVENVLKSKVGS